MAELTTKKGYMVTAKVSSIDIAAKPHDGLRLVKGPEPRTPDRENARISEPLLIFSESEMADIRSRWISLEKGFLDDSRRTVEDADKLVAWIMQRLAHGFSNEQSRLKKQWELSDSVSTEDLRLVLQCYRSLFDRLTETASTNTLHAPRARGLGSLTDKEHPVTKDKIA